MKTRFVITKVDKDGMRVLATVNQGRCFSDTREAAEAKLKAILNPETNSAATLKSVFGDISKMRVDEVECYDNGDCTGTVFGFETDTRQIMNPTHKKQGIRTPHSVLWRYRPETVVAANKIQIGTQNEMAHKLGMQEGEPLIVIMDALLNYAEAYRDRTGTMLASDGVLGQPWLEAARGIRALLNGQGAIAMRKDLSSDSFDGGACEDMFWNAMGMAGFTEEDLA